MNRVEQPEDDEFSALRAAYEFLEPLPVAEREEAAAALGLDPAIAAQALRMLAQPAMETSEVLGEDLAAVLHGLAMGVMPEPRIPQPVAEPVQWHQLPKLGGRPFLDPYVLLEYVGSGGFGEVYRGRHVYTEQEVAVKLLHAHRAGGEDGFAQLQREAKLGAGLASPFLVKVIDCNRRRGLVYLVMEWIAGQNLSRHVKQHGRCALAETAAILLDVAQGLADAHAAGVVHRDVNPNNILLGQDGRSRLTDLGLARHFADTQLQRSQNAVGTPPFMAPEQFGALAQAGPTADVYAVGATAYFLTTGGYWPRRHDVGSDPGLLALSMSGGMQVWFARCLAEDAANRYADGREMRAALVAALAEANLTPKLERALASLPNDAAAELERDVLRQVRQCILQAETQPAAESPVEAPCAEAAPLAAPPALQSAPRQMRPGVVRAWVFSAASIAAIAWSIWQFATAAVPGPQVQHAALPQPGPAEPAPTIPEVLDVPFRPEAPPPPAAVLASRIVAVRAEGAHRLSADEDHLILPAVPFGGVRDTRLVVDLDGELQDAAALQLLPQGVLPERAADGSWSFRLQLVPGEHQLTLQLHATERRLQLAVPSLPPMVPGLELQRPDQRLGVHYRLPLTESGEAMCFVWIREGLLGGVTEVSRGQFRSFVESPAYSDLLVADPVFGEWLRRSNNSLALRLQAWRQRLATAEHLPVSHIHICEAVAFARWLTGTAQGFRVVVPTVEQWCEVASVNCQRPVHGTLPFVGATNLINYRSQTGDALRAWDGRDPSGVRLELAPVWSQADGRLPLYHLAGNVSELCVYASPADGNPVWPAQVAYLGGDLVSSLAEIAVPQNPRRWSVLAADGKSEHEPMAYLGLRLVIEINS